MEPMLALVFGAVNGAVWSYAYAYKALEREHSGERWRLRMEVKEIRDELFWEEQKNRKLDWELKKIKGEM